MADVPKSLGINPYACTPGGVSKNFENIIKEIVEGGGRVRRFRLTANLSTGEDAAAVILTFDGTDYIVGDAIQVFDHYEVTAGTFTRGMWQGVTGMEGYCILREKPAVAGRMEGDIVWMEQYADLIEFTLTSAVSGGTATATVNASWGQGNAPASPLTVHDDQDNYSWGQIGDKGVAARTEYAAEATPGTPYYKIIEMLPSGGGEGGFPGGIVFFRLSLLDVEIGGSAPALVESGDAPVGTAITVYDPHSAFLRGMFGGPVGATGYAKRRDGSQTDYNIIWMAQKAFGIEFTLNGDLSGGSASATVTASWHQGIAPGATVTVRDDQSQFTDAVSGCKGMAWRSEYLGTVAAPWYKVVRCQRAASRATAELTGNMCGDAPAFNNWAIEPHGDMSFAVAAPAAISNDMIHRGQSGDPIRVVRTNNAPPFSWAIIDVEKKSQYVVMDIRESGDYIQTFGTTCAVEYCVAPIWSDKIPLTDC